MIQSLSIQRGLKNGVQDVRFRQLAIVFTHVDEDHVGLLEMMQMQQEDSKRLLDECAGRGCDDVCDIIVVLEGIFDAELHGHFPHAVAALFLPVENAPLSDGDDGVDIVKLESVVVEEANEEFSDAHSVLLGEAAEELQVARLVEVGIVGRAVVAVDDHLGEARAGGGREAVPVGRELLREREEGEKPGGRGGAAARRPTGGSG